jgi:hypothetical protein
MSPKCNTFAIWHTIPGGGHLGAALKKARLHNEPKDARESNALCNTADEAFTLD